MFRKLILLHAAQQPYVDWMDWATMKPAGEHMQVSVVCTFRYRRELRKLALLT